MKKKKKAFSTHIQFNLGLGKSLIVSGIDEEDNARDFGEIISPNTASLEMASQIVGREVYVAYRKLLRGYFMEGKKGERRKVCVVSEKEEKDELKKKIK